MRKKSTSFNLSDECKEMLKGLSQQMGLTRGRVVELLVRERAATEHYLASVEREYLVLQAKTKATRRTIESLRGE